MEDGFVFLWAYKWAKLPLPHLNVTLFLKLISTVATKYAILSSFFYMHYLLHVLICEGT